MTHNPEHEKRNNEGGENFEIVSIHTAEYRGGIPILNNDFNALARALEIYAEGVGPASNVTRDDYLRTARTSFNVALHFLTNPQYTEASPVKPGKKYEYSSNPFINDIVKKVREAYDDKKINGWSRSYDYDGQGRFHKTSVSVDFDRTNNALILRLYAAYVGDRVEKELATALGIERGVGSMVLTARLPDMPDQDLAVPLEQRPRFRLDCTPLAAIVNSVIRTHTNLKPFSPEDLALAFMKKNKFNEDEGRFTVGLGDDLALTLEIHGGYRFVFPSGKRGWENLVDTRIVKGSILELPFPTGPDVDKPLMDYSNPPKQIRNYSLEAVVHRESEDKYSRLPLHTTTQLNKGRAIIEQLRTEFQKFQK